MDMGGVMGKCLLCGSYVLFYYELKRITPKEEGTAAICASCVEGLGNLIRRMKSAKEKWSLDWNPQ